MTFLLVLAAIFGCKKEERLYEGEEGVYFAIQFGPPWGNESVWANQQISPVEFINIVGMEDTVQLKVMTTGRVKDYDRYFGVEVVADTTTALEGINFEPLEKQYMIKAGEHYTYLPVVLKRADNIQSEAKELVLRIVPTKDFTIGIPVWKSLKGQWQSDVMKGDFKADYHKLVISDFVSKPSEWIGRDNDGVEAGSWGVFTAKKFRLIAEEFGLVYQDFMSPTTMPGVKKENIREYMVRYLRTLYDKGTPVLEDDGRLMWFSGVPWTSRIGVPWKGF